MLSAEKQLAAFMKKYLPDIVKQAKEIRAKLQAIFPGAVLQPDASTSLDLVVGNNYTGVKTVKVGDPSTSKAATAPKPSKSSPPAVTAADARCG